MKRKIFKEKTFKLQSKESEIKNRLADSLDNMKGKSKKATSSIIGVGLILVVFYAIFKIFFGRIEKNEAKAIEDASPKTQGEKLLERGASGLISTLLTKFFLRYLFKKK